MPNFDEKTGIRYGVISPHSISSFALDDIYNNGTDPHYEYCKQEIINDLKQFCEDHNIDYDRIDPDQFVDAGLENYDNQDGQMDYSDKDYDLHISGDNFGIFVMRSPYYTFCRGCSPCAPGAGDLDNPVDKNQEFPEMGKTLCLGPEWFDEEKDQYSRNMPYKCYRVSDDTEVI